MGDHAAAAEGVPAGDLYLVVRELEHVVAGFRVTAQPERGHGPGVRDPQVLEAPDVGHVLVAREHHVDPGRDQLLEQVAGVHHGAAFAPGAWDRKQVVMQDEYLQVRLDLEPLVEPLVALAPDLALVDVGLARIHANYAYTLDFHVPTSGADQLLEVQVADVARIVVAGDRVHRRLDPLGVRDPVLELLPVALVRQVAAADDHVRRQLVQLHDDPVHQVRDEVGGADVRVGDVGDRDHGRSSLAPRAPGPCRRAWDDTPS